MDDQENTLIEKSANRIPSLEDACKSCFNSAKRKRRYSTTTPAETECELGCGIFIWEIHFSCLDCAEKFNKCPWCGKSPYEKCDKIEKESF